MLSVAMFGQRSCPPVCSPSPRERLFIRALCFSAHCLLSSLPSWAEPVLPSGDATHVELVSGRIASAEERGDAREVASAMLDLARYLLNKNLSGQSLEYARLARASHPAVDSDPLSLEIDIVLAAALQSSGRTAEALEILLETTSRAERLGIPGLELRSRLNLSSTYGRSGRLDNARQEIERGLELARITDNRAMQVRYLLNAARVSLDSGDGRTAEYIKRADTINVDPADPELERMLLLAGVSAALASGDSAQALARAERAFDVATTQGNDYYRAFALEYIARFRCELATDRDIKPLAQFAEAARAFDDLDQPHDGARLRRFWAVCLEGRGAYREALSQQREAGILQMRAQARLQVEAMEASEAAFRNRERSQALLRLESENMALARERGVQSARVAWLLAGLAMLSTAAVWQTAKFRLLQSRRAQDAAVARRQIEMLAFTGHEIRNPAQCLLGVLESGSLQPAVKDARALDLALSAARLVARLAAESLQLAKLEQDVFKQADAKPVALRQLILDCAMLVTQGANLSAERVSVENSEAVPEWMYSDASRLTQILLNLVSNALAYSDGLPVRVRCERALGERLVIEVLDQGPGLSAQDSDHLGVSFRRGSAASRNPHGSGLGLAISMRLAVTLGGVIGIRNRDGGGAVARLELPWRPCEAVSVKVAPGNHEGVNESTDLCVLVVDDDPMPRLGLAILLGSLGCRVDEAADGEELVRALQSRQYDLLLIDLNLGAESGTDLAERLFGARAGLAQRPCLAVVSGDSGDPELQLAHPLIDAWVSKPVSRQDAQQLLGLAHRKSIAER